MKQKEKKCLVIGVIGADVHAVGNRILYHAFTEAGFEVINLGVMVAQEEYIAAAISFAFLTAFSIKVVPSSTVSWSTPASRSESISSNFPSRICFI